MPDTRRYSTRNDLNHRRWTVCADGGQRAEETTPSSSLGSIETSHNQRDRQHNWLGTASFQYCTPRPPHLNDESSNKAQEYVFPTRTQTTHFPGRSPLPSTTSSVASTGMGNVSLKSLVQHTPRNVARHSHCPRPSIEVVILESKPAARRKICVGCFDHCSGSTEELRNVGGERAIRDELNPNGEDKNSGGTWIDGGACLDLQLDEFLRATEIIAAAPTTTVQDISTPVALSRLRRAFPEVQLNLGVLDQSSQEPVIAAYIAGLDHLYRCRRGARFISSNSVKRRPLQPQASVTINVNNDTQIADKHDEVLRPASAPSPRGATYSRSACGTRAYVTPTSIRPSPSFGSPSTVYLDNLHPLLSPAKPRQPQPEETREKCSERQPSSPRSIINQFNKRRHCVMIKTPAGHPTPPSLITTQNCNQIKTRRENIMHMKPKAPTTTRALQGARPDAGAQRAPEASALARGSRGSRGSRWTPFRPGKNKGRGARCCADAHFPVSPSVAVENEAALSIVGTGQGGEDQPVVQGTGYVKGNAVKMARVTRRTKGVGYGNEKGGFVCLAQRKGAMF